MVIIDYRCGHDLKVPPRRCFSLTKDEIGVVRSNYFEIHDQAAMQFHVPSQKTMRDWFAKKIKSFILFRVVNWYLG